MKIDNEVREEEKGYNIMQQTYIDSVDGAAHQSAVDIIGVAESRLAQEEKLHAEHNESARGRIGELEKENEELAEAKKAWREQARSIKTRMCEVLELKEFDTSIQKIFDTVEALRSRLAKLPESKKEVVNLIFDAIPYSTLNKFKDRASIAKGMDKLATALWEKYHDT